MWFNKKRKEKKKTYETLEFLEPNLLMNKKISYKSHSICNSFKNFSRITELTTPLPELSIYP